MLIWQPHHKLFMTLLPTYMIMMVLLQVAICQEHKFLLCALHTNAMAAALFMNHLSGYYLDYHIMICNVAQNFLNAQHLKISRHNSLSLNGHLMLNYYIYAKKLDITLKKFQQHGVIKLIAN